MPPDAAVVPRLGLSRNLHAATALHGGGRLRDQPNNRLRRRLYLTSTRHSPGYGRLIASCCYLQRVKRFFGVALPLLRHAIQFVLRS